MGPEKSGKTKIMDRLHNLSFDDNYTATIGVTFKTLKNKTSDYLEIWDLSGAKRFETLRPYYYRGSEIFCYCVDLSAEINLEQIQQELDQALTHSPRASIILVGTKADCCQNPQDKLNAITLKDIQVTATIVTSAKENNGLTDDQSNKSSLVDVLWAIANAIWEKKIKITKTVPPRSTQFPQSYHNIWKAEPGASDAAKSLLKDYSKVSNGVGFFASLQSTAKLLVTGHWGRNHHDAVLATLKEGYNNENNILSTLEEKLIEQGKPVNPKGSLAKRINFIQEKIGEKIIDIEELNRTIKENSNEKLTCCF